jgi:hypothetical protein
MAPRPHEPHFHPNDRCFIVISGTWWVGSGPNFDPNATVPVPAGSFVIHYAKGVHFDGAKDEQATILVWGEGSRGIDPLRRATPEVGVARIPLACGAPRWNSVSDPPATRRLR